MELAMSEHPKFNDMYLAAVMSHKQLWSLFVVTIAAIVCFPFLYTVYWIADEGVLLNGATKLLNGHNIYTDFFEFLPPGGFLLTEFWFSIAGGSFDSERLLALLTIVGIARFTFLSCRIVSKDAWLSLLITAAWLITSQATVPTQISHHWFTTFFSMFAAWASIANLMASPRRWWWPMIAGAAAGAALTVTPTRGLLALMAAATAWPSARSLRLGWIAFAVGCAIAPTAVLSYLISHHAVVGAFDDVVRFTSQRYASIQYVPFGRGANRLNIPLLCLFPFLLLILFLLFNRDWRNSLHDPVLRLCIAFGLAGFLGCFPRPDMWHLAFAAPLALPLLACCVNRMTRGRGSISRYVAAGAIIVVCLPSAFAYMIIIVRAPSSEMYSTPKGRVWFPEHTRIPELLARIAATPAEEKYFFYPYLPMLSYLTTREQVTYYDVFTPGYTLPAQYQESCISVMRSASWLVIDRQSTDPIWLKKVFPAMQNAQPPEAKKFEEALGKAFDLVAKEGIFELLHRRTGDHEALCEGIGDG
jgi:hypothetical protein